MLNIKELAFFKGQKNFFITRYKLKVQNERENCADLHKNIENNLGLKLIEIIYK